MKTSKFAALFILLALLLLTPVYTSRGEATEPRALCQEIGSTPTDLAVRRFVGRFDRPGIASCLSLVADALEQGPVCYVNHIWFTPDGSEAVIRLAYWPICEPPLGDESTARSESPPSARYAYISEPKILTYICPNYQLEQCLDGMAQFIGDTEHNKICRIEHIWLGWDNYDPDLSILSLLYWPDCP